MYRDRDRLKYFYWVVRIAPNVPRRNLGQVFQPISAIAAKSLIVFFISSAAA